MANLATTATESLQCIASAIRQQEGGSISSADLLDFLENEKERRNNPQNKEVLDHVKIPSNVIPFLLRWFNEGGVYEFPPPGYFEKVDDDSSDNAGSLGIPATSLITGIISMADKARYRRF